MFNFDSSEFENKDEKAIVFHSIDQHFPLEYLEFISEQIRDYKYKVMIVDEPIFGSGHHGESAKTNHLMALDKLHPDLVGYSCLYDCETSPANAFYWSNMVDIYVPKSSPSKENIIIGSGKKDTFRSRERGYEATSDPGSTDVFLIIHCVAGQKQPSRYCILAMLSQQPRPETS